MTTLVDLFLWDLRVSRLIGESVLVYLRPLATALTSEFGDFYVT